MTIVSSSPHALQRTCICTVYKQTYRQLQAEMDSLCQFLFRENALCMSGSITFALNSKRERKWELRYWRNVCCLLERGGEWRPCCALCLSVHYPTTSVKDMHTSRGWTWTVIGSGWLMMHAADSAVWNTNQRKKEPQDSLLVTKRLITGSWNVKEYVS